MALEKAFIRPLAGQLKGQDIEVLFNPAEYTISKSNNFSSVNIPGLESPLLQFVQGNLKTMTMTLFFDTYTYKNGEDVRNYTGKIVNLMRIDSDLHAPPVCLFYWGKLSFTCVIQQVQQSFTMFNSDGVPVRARLTVTFNEYTTRDQVKENPMSSPDRTKRKITKQGDSLWMLAAIAYGDATKWRTIADANNIENPRFLEPGMEIIIPPLE